MKSGIYKILNKLNGKFYIGSAVNLENRWREHKYHLNRDSHKNKHLQNSWINYGEIAFEFIILEYVEDKYKLIKIEQSYLDSLTPAYNMAQIAGSRAGVPMSEEAKNKIGAANKGKLLGRVMLQATKDLISLANKGKQNTKGRKQSAEEIAKRVAANTGKTRTKETKTKMSEARKGMIFSEAHKINLSLAAKRRWEGKRAAK